MSPIQVSAAAAQVESHEDSHADCADGEAEVAARFDVGLGLADALADHREERHATDEQTGE